MSQFEKALLVQPVWFSAFISCFYRRYWKWIETKRHCLHNECVKGCVFMCFPSHSSCFVKLPPVRWLTSSMRWNLASVDLTVFLIDEVISISLSALRARAIQLSHSLCTQKRCSCGISWYTYTLIKSCAPWVHFQAEKPLGSVHTPPPFQDQSL